MAEVTVGYTNTNDKDEAYEVAKAQITPEYIAKWNVTADIKSDDDNKYIEATGKGFKLSLSFHDSGCDLDCELKLFLKPFKKTLIETIQRKLEKHI